jgi:microcystin-dependent protein
MSFRRIQSQTTNRNVYLENRLNNFTKPPMHEGDLYVERDETVYGNLSVGKDLRCTNFYATGNYYLDTFVLIPAGTIIMSASVTEPGGWLDCNGRTLAKGAIGSVYYDLFLAIGYTYGGSGANFNVPDMRGRVGVGQGSGTGLTPRTLADISGAEMHTLTVAQMPNHSHSSNAIGGDGQTGLAHFTGSNTVTTLDNASAEISNISTAALVIDSVGGGLPHNNMQPYVVLRYLIKY